MGADINHFVHFRPKADIRAARKRSLQAIKADARADTPHQPTRLLGLKNVFLSEVARHKAEGLQYVVFYTLTFSMRG
jgi:hypothetical protein